MTTMNSQPKMHVGSWWASLLAALLTLAATPALARTVTLDEALDLAKTHNPNLAVARENIEQAKIQYKKAWVALLPTLSASLVYTRNNQEIALSMPNFVIDQDGNLGVDGMVDRVIQKQNSLSAGATLNVPLFSPRAIQGVRIAAKAREGGLLQIERAEQDILFAAAQTYYGVVAAQRAAEVKQTALEQAQAHTRATQARYDQQLIPETQLLSAQVVEYQAQQEANKAQRDLDVARQALVLMTGLDDDFQVATPEAVPAAVPASDELETIALAERPDYQAQSAQMDVALRSRTAVWWSYLPTLNAQGNYRWSDTEGFGGERNTWNLGLSANWLIFGGMSRFYELDQTASQIRQVQASRAAAADKIRLEIERARTGLLSAMENLKVARRQMDLADRNHKAMRVAFDNGACSQLEWQDAQSKLTQAQIGLTMQEVQLELSKIALAHAVGRFPDGRDAIR